MRSLAVVCALALSGCLVDGETPNPQPLPKPENAAVLAAVLDAVADVVEIDGTITTPRIVNTSYVTDYLEMALKYRVGDEDIFTTDWRKDYDIKYAAAFEPDGEAVPLTAETRRKAVAFLREQARAINGE